MPFHSRHAVVTAVFPGVVTSRGWHYRQTVLALCTFALFATMVARLAISPLVPAITATYGVSNALVGLALTGMWLTYGLAQYPSGVFADRYGERPVILVALAGTALGSLLIVTAPVFFVFAIATVILGALAGLHFSVATTLLTQTYDDVGRAIGIHTLGSTFGGLLAPIAATWIGVRYGWRTGVAIGLVVAIPAFALFFRYVEPTPPRRPDLEIRNQFRLEPLLTVLSRPSVTFTVVISVLLSFSWQALASFLPTFLVSYHEYSDGLAAIAFSGFFVVQGLTQVKIGQFSDQYGRDPVIAGCLVLAITGLLALVIPTASAFVVIGVVLVGVGLGAYTAAMARFMDLFSSEDRGAGFGLTQTVVMGLAAAGSVVTGTVADLAGWAASIAVLVTLLAIGLVLLFGNWALRTGY